MSTHNYTISILKTLCKPQNNTIRVNYICCYWKNKTSNFFMYEYTQDENLPKIPKESKSLIHWISLFIVGLWFSILTQLGMNVTIGNDYF